MSRTAAPAIKPSSGQRKRGREHEKGLCAVIPTHYQANNMNNSPPTSKVCVKCGKEKPATEFHKHPTNADGLQAYCKECASAVSRESRRRTKGKPAAVAGNPELTGVTDREIQERVKALLNELRARGWQAECKIAYLHTKTL